MATVQLDILGSDKSGPSFKSATNNVQALDNSVDRLTSRVTSLAGAMGVLYVSNKLWEGFTLGVKAVDDFQQAVIKSAAMITSLQGGENVADNYRKAKEYAEGLQDTLMKVDANTSLNLTSLQSITEEMIKQGVVLDGNNASQVEGFTRLANAAAVYSNNGSNEIQLRQEVRALMMGEVDQNSQLASMVQKMVQGPLQEQVNKWKQSGTLVEELGKALSGFGPASKDMNNTWSAVKSSLETSVNLILRGGFSEVVQGISSVMSASSTTI
jgi:prophage DNA circulation protein